MPISFKSALSSLIANATFLDKTVDDIKKGKLTLYKVNIGDAETIDHVQDYINDLADVDGVAGESDANKKVYSTNHYIADGDDRKVSIGKLDLGVKTTQDNLDAHIGDPVDAHAASAISFDNTISGLVATTSKGAIDEVEARVDVNETEIQAIEDSVGSANGICPLDGSAKVPALNLPSYVDDVEEYADLASFPVTGETGKIYVALDTNKTYRWSGTVYIEISPSDVNSVFGRTGIVVAQSGDYTPAQVGLGNVTDDAQLKRAAGDINTFTEKLIPVVDDIVIIEDSEDTFNKKKVKLENLLGSGGGGGSFQWELGDIAPLEEFENFMNVLSFESELDNTINAMITVPDSYKAGDQIFLKNSTFFSDGATNNVLFKVKTTLLSIGGLANSTTNQHTSTNAEKTLTTTNQLVAVGDMDLTDAVGEINAVAVAPLDILIIEFYRDVTNETVSSVDYAKFIKYSASVEFKP